jgi:hypothetical protein
MMHSNSPSFVNYYEQGRIAEEYAIARAIYSVLYLNVRREDMDEFFVTLFSGFRVFDDLATFRNCVEHPKCFQREQGHAMILSIITSENCAAYLKEQTVKLYDLMTRFPTVAIIGGSKTGKTTIVDMLSRA